MPRKKASVSTAAMTNNFNRAYLLKKQPTQHNTDGPRAFSGWELPGHARRSSMPEAVGRLITQSHPASPDLTAPQGVQIKNSMNGRGMSQTNYLNEPKYGN